MWYPNNTIKFKKGFKLFTGMALEILKKIGLSEGEITIYSALLDLGKAPLNKIHEKTGIERRNIYDILNKLIERGLVSYVLENKRRLFQISHPNKIKGYVEEKKHELEEIGKEIEKEIPLVLEKFNFKRPEINAEIYRGVEGIKAIFEDTLNYKENYFIGGGWYIAKKLPHYWANYNKRRIKSGVKWYNLSRYETKKEEIPEKRLTRIKFLPEEFSGNPNVIFIYGDKVANVLWGKEFFAFVIESKEIAENYKRYHKYLWNKVAKS